MSLQKRNHSNGLETAKIKTQEDSLAEGKVWTKGKGESYDGVYSAWLQWVSYGEELEKYYQMEGCFRLEELKGKIRE